MYAELNTTEKLTVTRTRNRRHRFLYQIINIESGEVLSHRYSNRKFICATVDGRIYYSRLVFAQVYNAELRREGLADAECCYLEDASAFDNIKPIPVWTVSKVL